MDLVKTEEAMIDESKSYPAPVGRIGTHDGADVPALMDESDPTRYLRIALTTHPIALAPLPNPGKSPPNAGKPHRIDHTKPCIFNRMATGPFSEDVHSAKATYL